jgi:integrase
VPLLDRPILSASEAQALVAETREDPLLYGAAVLMLLAGARPLEVTEAKVADYQPGSWSRLLLGRRGVCIAPTAARALDAYLATQDAGPEEPLLLGLQTVGVLPRLLRRAAKRAGVEVGIHMLRRAAIAAAWEDGAPPSHIEAYFGISKALDAKALVALPKGYDAAMARTLEAAFGA